MNVVAMVICVAYCREAESIESSETAPMGLLR